MKGKDKRVFGWHDELREPQLISRLSNAEPGLCFTEKHIDQIDNAISVALDWKRSLDPADARLAKIRTAAADFAGLLQDHIDQAAWETLNSRNSLPGCENAVTLLACLKSVAASQPRKGKGRPSDEVIDFMISRLSEIYHDAGGIGTHGSRAFAYFLDELAHVIPEELSGSRSQAFGAWLTRRAKDLGQVRPSGTRKATANAD